RSSEQDGSGESAEVRPDDVDFLHGWFSISETGFVVIVVPLTSNYTKRVILCKFMDDRAVSMVYFMFGK
ncbi:MAG: hypothetical protein UHI93_00260, partial [Acutalibacteraceae bacterium]|nr:hypothetical protein [Acutalibacteraceae bacterium]